MWKKIDKALTALEDGIMGIGLLSGAIVLFVNIVLRYVFSHGLHWAEEYVRFSIVWIVFFGSGGVARRYAHLSVSALIDSVSKKNAWRLTTVTYVITIGFVIFLAVFGFRLTFETYQLKQYSPAMSLPMWLMYLPIGLGGVMMTLRFIQMFVAHLKNPADTSHIPEAVA